MKRKQRSNTNRSFFGKIFAFLMGTNVEENLKRPASTKKQGAKSDAAQPKRTSGSGRSRGRRRNTSDKARTAQQNVASGSSEVTSIKPKPQEGGAENSKRDDKTDSQRKAPRSKSGNQRRRTQKPAEAQTEQPATEESADIEGNVDRPRKRPNEMKRSDAPRRRRNRGRKPVQSQAASDSGNHDSPPATVESISSASVASVSSNAPEEFAQPSQQDTPATGADQANAMLSAVGSTPPQNEESLKPNGESTSVAAANELADAGTIAEPQAAPIAPSEIAEETETPVVEVQRVSSTIAQEEAPVVVSETPESSAAEASVPAPPEETTDVPDVVHASDKTVQTASSTDGIADDGRALNDPRVKARPVESLEITTAHPVLFSEVVAPPVAPTTQPKPRAVNDPRGQPSHNSVEQAVS